MWLGDAYAPAPGPGGAETLAVAAAVAPAAPDVVQNPLTNVLSSLLVGRRLSEGEGCSITGGCQTFVQPMSVHACSAHVSGITRHFLD
jgi:hypothetical protein